MIAISRFRCPGVAFDELAAPVTQWWSACEGCIGIDVVQNLDEPDLWAIVGRWQSVGAYRRSFNGYEAKMLLTPLLSRAIDEPSAYLPADETGLNVPRSL